MEEYVDTKQNPRIYVKINDTYLSVTSEVLNYLYHPDTKVLRGRIFFSNHHCTPVPFDTEIKHLNYGLTDFFIDFTRARRSDMTRETLREIKENGLKLLGLKFISEEKDESIRYHCRHIPEINFPTKESSIEEILFDIKNFEEFITIESLKSKNTFRIKSFMVTFYRVNYFMTLGSGFKEQKTKVYKFDVPDDVIIPFFDFCNMSLECWKKKYMSLDFNILEALDFADYLGCEIFFNCVLFIGHQKEFYLLENIERWKMSQSGNKYYKNLLGLNTNLSSNSRLNRILKRSMFIDKTYDLKEQKNVYLVKDAERKNLIIHRVKLNEEERIVVYLLHVQTLITDRIIYFTFKNEKYYDDPEVDEFISSSFSCSTDCVLSIEKFKYPNSERMFLDINTYTVELTYPRKYLYNIPILNFFEERVDLKEMIPNLEYIGESGFESYYRYPTDEMIIYLIMIVNADVKNLKYFFYVGFDLKNGKRCKDEIVKESVTSYVTSMFLRSYEHVDRFKTELSMIDYSNRHLSPYVNI